MLVQLIVSFLYSSSRDNVLNMWDVSDKKLLKTIPAFEVWNYYSMVYVSSNLTFLKSVWQFVLLSGMLWQMANAWNFFSSKSFNNVVNLLY